MGGKKKIQWVREVSVKNKKDISDINLIPNSSLVFYYFEGDSASKIDSKWFIMLNEVLLLILERAHGNQIRRRSARTRK